MRSPDKGLVSKVGSWVVGDEFWDREEEIGRLIEQIGARENILLVAPRRVGKTSLLREILRRFDVTRHNCYGVFVDVQDCTTPEEVVVALSLATKKHQKLWHKTLQVFQTFLETLKETVDEVGSDVLTFKLREAVSGDWRAKGNRLLEGLATADRPVVLCLDELPVMLNRLLMAEGGLITPQTRNQADVFLSWLRLAAGNHQGRISFVICGSIGLEPIARRADLSHTIAHLRPFHLSPWGRDVADGCLSALAIHYALALEPVVRSAMLDQLGCFIPQHVQMFFAHLLDDCRRRKADKATVEDVGRVFDRFMLGTRGHAELADYEERLLRVLGPDLTPLALELLTEAAVTGSLNWENANTIAQSILCKSGDTASNALRTVLEVLEHDGYFSRDPEGRFEFVSRLVREWWRRRFGTGYIPSNQRTGA